MPVPSTACKCKELEAPRLVVVALQVIAAISAGLVGMALFRGLETSRIGSFLPDTATRVYTAMSPAPSMSSAPQCIFDALDGDCNEHEETRMASEEGEEGQGEQWNSPACGPRFLADEVGEQHSTTGFRRGGE